MKGVLIACPVCEKVHEDIDVPPGFRVHCARCGAGLRRSTPGSLHYTAAFTLRALLLYVPAKLFPILSMSLYGRVTDASQARMVLPVLKRGKRRAR